MNLLVSLEHRFDATPDGRVWTHTVFPHSFWKRYLEVFDHVRVAARVRPVAEATASATRADGDGVTFAPVPCYLGPWQYLVKACQVQRAVRGAVGSDEAVIMRVGSQIASHIEPMLRRAGRPYGLEVVGDPYDVFAPGAVRHPLRPFFRWWFSRRLRQQCAHASAVAYVTERALQRRYPPAPDAFTTHYSSIELPDAAFVAAPRRAETQKTRFTLVFVGSLAQLYKAPDVLIEATARCSQDGLDVQLVVVGDGRHRPELEAQAAALGLGGRARFLGHLPAGDAVRAQLDGADLFVLPSRQEGLPRAMIEAMARALPCVGSTVGGIPELLPPEDLVPPGDAGALAHKIRDVLSDPERMARMSARNLEKAREYCEDVLRARRIAFYTYVRERTQAWLEKSL